MAVIGKCTRCGCDCDSELCSYCILDRARFMEAKALRDERKRSGLCCRKCGCDEMPVYYTRRAFGKIRRVRKCRNCDTQVTTWETDQ